MPVVACVKQDRETRVANKGFVVKPDTTVK